MIQTTLEALLPLVFVMGVGYFARRTKRLDEHQAHGIRHVLIEFALPAALFVGITDSSRAELMQSAPLLGALLLTFALLWFIAFVVARVFFRHDVGTAGLQAMMVAYANTGFVGVPIMGNFFGAPGVAIVGLTTVMGTLLFIPATVILLEMTRNASAHAHESKWRGVALPAFWNAARAPLVWAPLAAAALVLFGIVVPREILNMLNLLGSITAGLAMFAAGATLAMYSLRVDFEIGVNVFLKMCAQPLLIILLLSLFGIGGTRAEMGVIICVLPTGVLATILAARYHTYQAEASSTLVLTSLVMLVMLPVWRIVLG